MAGETPPMLVLALRSVAAEAVATAEAPQRSGGSIRRRKRMRKSEDHRWDKEGKEVGKSGSDDRRQMRWWLLGGVVLFGVMVSAVVMALLGGERGQHGAAANPAPTVAAPTVAVKSTAAGVDDLSDVEFMTMAKPMVETFMNATSVAELLTVVRDPEVVRPRMEAWYADGRVVAPGMSAFDTGSGVTRDGSVLSVVVRTRDYEEKMISFAPSSAGLRIDWESSVAWSEQPWQSFMEKREQTPKLFRVIVQPVEYYNFEFTDDHYWQSFFLESLDGKLAMYGYVPRGSPLSGKLRLAPEVTDANFTLRLKFPAHAKSSNQVIIDSVVADSWVIVNPQSK